MAEPDASPSDLAALERFVVDNDDLLALEEQIGRFNIFDALRIVDREVKHSDFLAWLLDPNESHGQSGLFLRAILMDLFKTARENGFPCPASPIELDGEDLRGVEVRREWKNIDLLVRCQQPDFVIAIENKIKSGEHSDQLSRYRQTVEGEFGQTPSMYVFLTVEGDEASEEDWVPYSYGDIHRVLLRVRNANESSIGEDVLAFLDHYVRLLRGRLMDDPKIDELCQRIYKNHRQAIELIWDRGRPSVRELASIVSDTASRRDLWRVYPSNTTSVHLIPYSWLQTLPPVRENPKHEPNKWFNFEFRFAKNRLEFWIYACPTTDQEIRRRVLERLVRDPDEFGFRLKFKSIPPKWATILKRVVLRWDVELPKSDQVTVKVDQLLARLERQIAGVPDALRPIIDEWKNSQNQ